MTASLRCGAGCAAAWLLTGAWPLTGAWLSSGAWLATTNVPVRLKRIYGRVIPGLLTRQPRAGSSAGDGDGGPCCAERDDPVAVGLAGCSVALERVQRMAVVGGLHGAV